MSVGARGVSIKDVADLAGVAVSSVSRVLADHPDVSASMRERVLDAVEQSGYRPNTLAQGLRSGRTMSIGLVVGDISNPLMAEIALAAERALATNGFTLVIANSRGDPRREADNIAMFQHRQVDGLLVSVSDEQAAAVREALADFQRPVVLLDREIDVPSVVSAHFDHSSGFRAAVEHLAQLGHRRVDLIAGDELVRPTRERIRAVRDASADLGLELPQIAVGNHDRQQGRVAMARLLAESRPTAMICGGNQLLPGVLDALRAAGLVMPTDISLVTTDNIGLAEFHNPPIASIARDATSLGELAATALLEMVGGTSTNPQIAPQPTRYHPAGSCAAPSRT